MGGETGDRFLDDTHLYASDLDLFGDASLFISDPNSTYTNTGQLVAESNSTTTISVTDGGRWIRGAAADRVKDVSFAEVALSPAEAAAIQAINKNGGIWQKLDILKESFIA